MSYLVAALIFAVSFLGYSNQYALPHLITWITSGYDMDLTDFKLAENGNPVAIMKIADMYFSNQEFPMAVLYYKKASDLKYTPAMIKLSQLYKSGIGTPKNKIKANRLLLEATKLGDMDAIEEIGNSIKESLDL